MLLHPPPPIRNGRPGRDLLEFAVISGEIEEIVRERWYQTIPEQYRNDGRDRDGYHQHAHLSSAIILPPPPRQILDRFYAAVSAKMHLTQAQLRESRS